jgi:universal stress protein E
MAEFRNVLVAIRDLEGRPTALLRKAAAISAPRARIELLHVMTGPVTVSISGIRQPREAVDRALQAATQRVSRRLERLARSPALRANRLSVHVTWDYPIGDAIVRRACKIGADLVVAGTEPHRVGARWLLANTDWELIREVPCPLLIVKRLGPYGRTPVLAAVDPFHANDKPARLDVLLLKAARSLAAALNADVHIFHAYAPLAALLPASLLQPVPIPVSPAEDALYGRQVRRNFDALAARAAIPRANRHLRIGEVPAQLSNVVRETRAQIVVMGALSRSGIRRAFIGNTAERVLDRLGADLLVVKPRGFKTRVPMKAAYVPMRGVRAETG